MCGISFIFWAALIDNNLVARLCYTTAIVKFFEPLEGWSRAWCCQVLLRCIFLKSMTHMPNTAVLALVDELIIRGASIHFLFWVSTIERLCVGVAETVQQDTSCFKAFFRLLSPNAIVKGSCGSGSRFFQRSDAWKYHIYLRTFFQRWFLWI